MKYIRANEPIEKIDISYPMSWVEAMAIRDEKEAKGYSVEFRASTDGKKKVELYIYERVLIK